MKILKKAPGKVNLSLLVGPRRPDGYHHLFTVFLAVELYDELEFSLSLEQGGAKPGAIELECPGLDGEDNLVLRALHGMERLSGQVISGHVVIRKGIPVGAGMGGGSSDAAAALSAAAELLRAEADIRVDGDRLLELARSLGADVPFFVGAMGRPGAAAIALGIGDELRPIELPPVRLVIVLPDNQLATKDVYAAFDTVAPPERSEEFTSRAVRAEAEWLAVAAQSDREGGAARGMERVAALMDNDLEKASFSLTPNLAGIKRDILQAGASAALMSGSGPTMFGIAPSDRVEAEKVVGRLRAEGYSLRTSGM